MNTTTPRIFVAATRQDDGKTTTCLGLFHAIAQKVGTVGYIKPVGQRYVDVNGLRVDEDTFLMDRTYEIHTPLEDMSPITVDGAFTRQFIEQGDVLSLERKLMKSFDRATWEKNFVIIEGSGHAGVGSVFDLNNARVSRLLHSRAVIVTRGGVGAPVDEVALNMALFEKHGVPVVGVILNKVLPDKLEMVSKFARTAFAKMKLPVLGVLPYREELQRPTVGQIATAIKGRYLHGEEYERRTVEHIVVGAMAARHLTSGLMPRSLVITPGDRDDVVLAVLLKTALETHAPEVAGIVLTRNERPPESILQLVRRCNIPVLLASDNTYDVAAQIKEMKIKTEADDKEKIGMIQNLINEHVDIPRLLAAVGVN